MRTDANSRVQETQEGRANVKRLKEKEREQTEIGTDRKIKRGERDVYNGLSLSRPLF